MLLFFLILVVLVSTNNVIDKNLVGCSVVKYNKVKTKSKFWYKITMELKDESKSTILFISEKVGDAEQRDNDYRIAKKKFSKLGEYYCDFSVEKNKVLEIIPLDEVNFEGTAFTEKNIDTQNELTESDVKSETPHKEIKSEEDISDKITSEETEKTEIREKEIPVDPVITELKLEAEVADDTKVETKKKKEGEESIQKESSPEETPEYKEVEKIKEVLKDREDKRKEELEGTVNQKLQDIFRKKKKKKDNNKTDGESEGTENFVISYFKNFLIRFTEVRWMLLVWIISKFLIALVFIGALALALRILLITRYRPTLPLIQNTTASELHSKIVGQIESFEVPHIKPIGSTFDRKMSDFFDKHEYDRYITRKVASKRIEELILLKYLLQNDGEILKELFPETPFILSLDTLSGSFKDEKRTSKEFKELLEEETVESSTLAKELEKNESFGIGTSLFCVLWNGKSEFTERQTYFTVVKMEYVGTQTAEEKLFSENEETQISHNPFRKRSKQLSFSKKEKEEYTMKRIRRMKCRIAEHASRFLAEMGLYLSCLSQGRDPIQVEVVTNHDVRSMDSEVGKEDDEYQEFRYRNLGAEPFIGGNMLPSHQKRRINLTYKVGKGKGSEIWGSKTVLSSNSQSEIIINVIEDDGDEEEEEGEGYSSNNSLRSTESSSDSLLSMGDEDVDEDGVTRNRRDSLDETLQLNQELEEMEEEDESLKKKLQEMIENDEMDQL